MNTQNSEDQQQPVQDDPFEAQQRLIKNVKKSDLHVFLKCPLCTGFYRDAHTINECLDTFCKSCIFKYFCDDTNRESCPKCNTHLGGRPLESIIADQTIQNIVDMLYPQFQQADQEAIRVMYELFQQVGTPLPKDPNLIDYGFKFTDDFEEKQQLAVKEAQLLRM